LPSRNVIPVVQHIKKQLGIIEPLVFQENGSLEIQCLYLIVQAPQVVKSGTLIDHTPILIPISLVDKMGYRYLIPLGNNHIPGLFGLDLNLLIATDMKENQFLQKFKTTLITNLILFAKSLSEKEKVTYRQLICTQLRTLWLDHSKKPFINIQLKHIRFQRRLDLLGEDQGTSRIDHSSDYKLLMQLRQFRPSMEIF